MMTSFWATLFSTSGFLANIGLIYTLFVKTRWRKFPWFSTLIAFEVLRTVTLFAVRRTGDTHAYFWSFWSLAFLDYLLQLSVITEIGLIVLKQSVRAAPEVKSKCVAWSLTVILFAGVVAFTIPGPSNGEGIWDTRLSLFTSLVIAQCYLVMSISFNHLGLRRNAHVLALGNGLVIWSAMDLIAYGAYAATAWRHEFPTLDKLQVVAYQLATVYWAVRLWPEEPTEALAVAPPLVSTYERLDEQQYQTTRDGIEKRAS